MSFQVRVLALPQEQVQSGAVKALLYYRESQTSYGFPQYTNVRRYSTGSGIYNITPHLWGDLGYQLVGTKAKSVAFVSADDSFAYAFTSFADSLFPIQIWRYRFQHFTNVTRQFPARIRADAAQEWHYFNLSRNGGRSVRGALAAWVADECLVRDCARAYTRVEALGSQVLTSQYDFDSVPHYLASLRALLRRTGYWR